MAMTDLIRTAMNMAMYAHRNQERKFTGEPYWHHLAEVAGIVETVQGSGEMIAAAWLHDTLEDTDLPAHAILDKCGEEVLHLVFWLTDVSQPKHGNREMRKRFDRWHMAQAPWNAQTIKLADMLSNSVNIVKHDPNFAKVYLREKHKLLIAMPGGDHRLRSACIDFLERNKHAFDWS
jgi:(p)ppGpp synthase/HD superfamily hydrolase